MKVIVNRRAGRGRAGRVLEVVRAELSRRGMAVTVWETEYPGHGIELGRRSVQEGEERILVIGGDGTVSEVASSLLEQPTELAIVPSGTGNDLARTLRIPLRNPAAAAAAALDGRARLVDAGRVGPRCFLSILGVGFPALVAESGNRLRWLRGWAAFMAATYRNLNEMRSFELEMELDGRLEQMDCTSIMVQNTPFTGGGLLLAPAARPDDGFLDVVSVDKIGKLDLMFNFPSIYRGRHVGHPHFYHYRCRRLVIRTNPKQRVVLDGDAHGETPIEISLKPSCVQVVTGG